MLSQATVLVDWDTFSQCFKDFRQEIISRCCEIADDPSLFEDTERKFLSKFEHQDSRLCKLDAFALSGGSFDEVKPLIRCIQQSVHEIRRILRGNPVVSWRDSFFDRLGYTFDIAGFTRDEFRTIVRIVMGITIQIIPVRMIEKRGYCRQCRTDDVNFGSVTFPNGKEVEAISCPACIVRDRMTQGRIMASIGFVGEPKTEYSFVLA